MQCFGEGIDEIMSFISLRMEKLTFSSMHHGASNYFYLFFKHKRLSEYVSLWLDTASSLEDCPKYLLLHPPGLNDVN